MAYDNDGPHAPRRANGGGAWTPEMPDSANCVDDRTATARANSLADRIGHAADLLDDLLVRLGRGEAPKKVSGTTAAGLPPRFLLDSLGDSERALGRVHEVIVFMQQTL